MNRLILLNLVAIISLVFSSSMFELSYTETDHLKNSPLHQIPAIDEKLRGEFSSSKIEEDFSGGHDLLPAYYLTESHRFQLLNLPTSIDFLPTGQFAFEFFSGSSRPRGPPQLS